MRYAWRVLALGLALGMASTALGQNAPRPPMIRAAMKAPPRHWTTTDGKTISVRFLTADRSKAQLLLGDGPSPRIVTVRNPYLDGPYREWIAEGVQRAAQWNKKPLPW